MDVAYGFPSSTFQCLRTKASSMSPNERRGTLMIDEMHLQERMSFDSKTCKIMGFTDLGEFTPDHQLEVPGDHALVFMFQPLQGPWVQAFGSFLARGCTPGIILHQLVLQCVLALEQSGFYVDVVTTDGASWNRTMWSKFGISVKKPSCFHPQDEERRLWCCSDFPHLVKCIRNRFVSSKIMLTPDGTIDIKHWEYVINMDDPKAFTLKVCPKLTPAHLNPKNYQKMKVSWAFQIFSASAAVGMEIYAQRNNKSEEIEPSIQFTKRMNTLIDILNSGSELTALRTESQVKFLEYFLTYLDDWERLCIVDKKSFLTPQTALGLQVTIQSTIELHNFLVTKCDYKYLLTCRIQQDALERFFGMIRSAGGCNTDPDPILFAQTFRLLSVYSLVKPPHGSNIGKGDILKSMLEAKDLKHNEPRPDILENLDAIFDAGDHLHEMDYVDDAADLFLDGNQNEFSTTTDVRVKSYIAGYVVRKIKKMTSCEACIALMIAPEPTLDRDGMIVLKIRAGLILPSNKLFKLISAVEYVITEVLQTTPLNNDTLSIIVNSLLEKHLQTVECDKCEQALSLRIVRFYVIMRLHFACRRFNSINNQKKEKARLLRKQSRLT